MRRRAQLKLIEGMCETHAAATIAVRRRVGTTGEARFEALAKDRLVLSWDGARNVDAEIEGQPLEIHFEEEGERYVCFVTSRGLERCEDENGQRRSQLVTSVPLRVETARERDHLRLEFDNEQAIVGTFTHVVDTRRQFQARVTDVSSGGLGVVTVSPRINELYTGDLFWVDLELPGEQHRSEFIVRLVHLRPLKHSDQLAMGWAFQAGDDPIMHRNSLRRLQRIAGRMQPGNRNTKGEQ
ncbi:PilZ domain-containing protein [uncultured Ilyobacter sp.]|uniref:PilZ domain-containing protein n=1 Tax=uncultured Ilyobacter sp. TaxID=544433 RepID=UPI0037486CF9